MSATAIPLGHALPHAVDAGDHSPASEKLDGLYVEKVNTTWDDTPIVSPELEARITRKFDRHVVPWLFGLWLLAFIDRSNIGNARIDGLSDDLKLTGTQFN
ncbi:hypothetical protein B0A49_00001, partial [Cryomyces minteri]